MHGSYTGSLCGGAAAQAPPAFPGLERGVWGQQRRWLSPENLNAKYPKARRQPLWGPC